MTHQSLDVFQRAFKKGLLKSKIPYHKKKNLTNGQYKGLKELTDNPEITIQKAEKGSAVIVMNTTDYLREGYKQLSDSNYYTKLDHDPTTEISENNQWDHT